MIDRSVELMIRFARGVGMWGFSLLLCVKNERAIAFEMAAIGLPVIGRLKL